MASSGKKIFQVAKELLVGHAEIVAFLQKSGYKTVKNHMSVVDDEMMEKILARFSKEKKHAELYQKQKDLREKKEHPEPDKTEKPVTTEPEKISAEAEMVPSVSETSETPVVEETQIQPVTEVIEISTVTETLITETAATSDTPIQEKKASSESEEKKAEKKKELLETLKASPKTLEEFKQAFEKARQQLEKQALKDEHPSGGYGKKGKKKADAFIDDEAVVEKPVREKKKKRRKAKIDEKDVELAIKETLAKMGDTSTLGEERQRRKKKLRAEREAEAILSAQHEEVNILRVPEFITAHELADQMEVDVSEVIKTCLSLGLIVSINQRLDMDTMTLVASEFGYQIEAATEFQTETLIEDEDEEQAEELPRPPIVTIMGHVDHGKTSLLDYIKKTNVVAGEAGGITQHMGAYEVVLPDNRKITFLDTPGHEAFTAMRARGAQVTDIVVIVIAADEQIMPQTDEAINHAQAAGVPIIFAINKIDKPEADPMRIKTQLTERNILIEEWGGKYQCVEISAKKGINVDVLLEKILLEAEIAELKAKVNCRAKGTVIISELDKGRGASATIVVESGTLKIGDPFICGIYSGRVKAMYDERDRLIKEAYPSQPVKVIGFDGLPQEGDILVVTKNERIARELAMKRQQIKREQDHRRVRLLTLDEISKQVRLGKVETLPIILKGDVGGSIEALSDSIQKLSNSQVTVNIIHKGVGVITESDVLLASASNAIIIGFHVRPNLNARKLAERENIDIRYYNIIYNCIEDIRKALEGLLEPEFEDKVIGTTEIREIFKISKVGTVAGCHVVDGKISRTLPIRLIRNGEVIYEGKLSSLKRFKDDVREVLQGFDCGLTIDGYNDIKNGDIIESLERVEIKRTMQD